MKIALNCPQCSKKATLSDEFVGRSVRCPACRHKFKVPAAETQIQNAGSVLKDTLATPGAGLQPPVSSEMPAKIGRFVVKQKLGAGAFGAVYRAVDTQLQREVAVKVPHAKLRDNPRVLERFLREAKAVAQLQHPNIVPVYEAGQDGDLLYIASAFIEGKPLSEVVEGCPLPLTQAAEIVRQLSEALSHAHELGIVHRDVKPDNVMIDAAGQPCLMDFGLASRTDGGEKLTHAGAIMGTPAYMPPEHAEGQPEEPKPASDQYSLGVLMYELIVGQTPFSGPPALVLYHAVKTTPPSIRNQCPDVPEELETICNRAMAKRAEERYPGCQEFANDLRRWQEGQPIRAKRESVFKRNVRWCKKHGVLAGLLGGTAACLLLASMMAAAQFGSLQAEKAKIATAEKSLKEEGERAERERNNAIAEEQAAREASETTTTNEEKAIVATALADAEKSRADREHTATKSNVEKARQTTRDDLKAVYDAHLLLAERLIREGRPRQAEGWLSAWLPENSGVDVTGGTWQDVWERARRPAGYVGLLEGHTGGVSSVAWSSDGKRILTGSYDKTAKVWDADKGTQVLTLKGHTDLVWGVAWSADGKRILTGSKDTTAKVWDADTGTEVLTLKGHTRPVTSVAWSPDGKRILTGSTAWTAKVWDADKGTQVRTLEGHTDSVLSVAWSADGKRILTGSVDQTARVWDAVKFTQLLTLKGHTYSVSSVAWSADGKRILTGGGDSTVKVWDADTGTQVLTLKGHTGYVLSVAWSADGKRILTGSVDKTAKVWDAVKGTEVLSLTGHTDRVTSVAWSPDGKRILTSGSGKTAKVWLIEEGQETGPLK